MKTVAQPRSHPDLLKGSINQNIIRMSLPMIVAMLFQSGFSVIDMVFVGMVVLALFMLCVAGVSILFAKPIASIFTQDA